MVSSTQFRKLISCLPSKCVFFNLQHDDIQKELNTKTTIDCIQDNRENWESPKNGQRKPLYYNTEKCKTFKAKKSRMFNLNNSLGLLFDVLIVDGDTKSVICSWRLYF